MKSLHLQRTLSFLMVIGLVLGLVQPAVAGRPQSAPPIAAAQAPPAAPAFQEPSPQDPQAKIEPQVMKELEAQGSGDYFIWLVEQADLGPAALLATKEEKGRFVFEALRETADRTQAELRSILKSQGVAFRPFYISNKILVRGGSLSLLNSLAARPDVARITANHKYQLQEPFEGEKEPAHIQAIEPNLTFVNADDVWALGITGQGSVVAGNDTGLDWDHPALINQYRGWDGSTANHNYNWWDSTGTYPTAPGDGDGHGTHTTGTMVGDDGAGNQIGIAPGARTIHCKNLNDFGGGDDFTISECFEWDLAPWDLTGQNPRPDLAPDAINNSWGYWGGGFTGFQDEIAALQAAGILVEVSAGNEGPSCQSLRSPGDYGEVLTTGSVNHAGGVLPGTLTWFSSRGPSSLTGDFLPDIMAPGENIRSSVPGGGYTAFSGTSMSGPHVTGLVGLLWSANPGLRGLVPETNQILQLTAIPLSGQSGSGCGGDYSTGPNHDWGFGTIDALAAVEAAVSFGDPGTLTGAVTDSATSNPLPGARVQASLTPDLTWSRITDGAGVYSLLVFSGTYTVTAGLYGYFPDTFTGVQVTSFSTTTLDIPLDPAPFYLVSGQVTDAQTGWPLYAQIDISGYPGEPIWTDPETGAYSVSLAAGMEYQFNVTAWVDGYQTAIRTVGPLTGPQTEDFALQVDQVACTAPGYQPEFVYFEDFEIDDGGYVASGFTTWAWGAPTSGPGAAHSGDNVWATNLEGDYFDNENGQLTSPLIDMSAYAGQAVIVTWWQWLETENGFDYAWVEVSNDGGGTWTTVYGPVSGAVDLGWTKHTAVLDATYAVSNFQVRFTLQTDFSVTMSGFYLDDVGIGAAALPPALFSHDFEANNGGFVAAGTNSSWAYGVPTRGPGAAHSGTRAWATRLGGNYNNNEDSELVSQDIDLSSASGQSLALSWWSWLQTEATFDQASVEVSDDGGATWAPVFGPASGVITTAWERFEVVLDPTYADIDFRLRFTLQTDGSVTYPGFYLDDLRISEYSADPPAVPCNAPNGGLVVGHVFDANTATALDGAKVARAGGEFALTAPTPLDPAVDDGLYTLFAPAGTQVLTATRSGGYGQDVQTPVVVLGDAVRQDFDLPAGLLSTTPPSLAVNLDMGLTTDLPLTLTNAGGLELSYELRERNGAHTPLFLGLAFQPGQGEWLYQAKEGVELAVNQGEGATAFAFPAAYRWQPEAPTGNGDILVYADDPYHFLPFTYVDQALQFLGLAYTAHYEADFIGFESSLAAGGWDVVIFANDNWFPPNSTLDALDAYLAGGGKLIAHSWTMGFSAAHPLWSRMGFAWAGDDVEPPDPVYWWDPANRAFTFPQEVPEFTMLEGFRYGIYGQSGNSLEGTDALAGYTTPGPTPGQAALVLGNEGRSVFRGFMDGQNDADLDFDGLPDGVELWINLIDGIRVEFSNDIPWLTTDIITGTLSAGGSQAIQVSFDAGVPEVDQPGDYDGILRFVADTPYGFTPVPVTMSVNPPATWGKLTGAVTGLARCDAPGASLNDAQVEIAGVATTETGPDGLYVRWMEQGVYTVTISAAGYVTQTMSANIIAGQSLQLDADLRLDAPCAAAAPESFSISLPAGWALTQTLTLENAGAGGLSFQILESEFSLSSTAAPDLQKVSADVLPLQGLQGPASVRPLAAQTGAAVPDSPLSGWFGGVEIPGGVVRYAYAQCDGQPDTFYVFSGVDGFFGISRGAWRYDAAGNAWTALAPIPAGQEAPTAACHAGRIYVMGGGGTDQFYIYDITSNSWSSGPALPRPVEGAAAAAWDGKVYLIGGDDDFWPGSGVSSEVNIYDIAANAWTGTGASMPVGTSMAGFAQTGPLVYLVGGFGETAPDLNLDAVQRYDISTDSWEVGPALGSARADMALAATDQALYAIGGDADGGWFFDATAQVERLDLTAWPGGAWADLGDPLPAPLAANNAGFCSTAVFNADVSEIWSTGGLDSNFVISGRHLFREQPGESCYSIFGDVDWLSAAPVAGTVGGDEVGEVSVTFDATNLPPGVYQASLVVTSNDSGAAQEWLPVTLVVLDANLLYLPLVTR